MCHYHTSFQLSSFLVEYLVFFVFFVLCNHEFSKICRMVLMNVFWIQYKPAPSMSGMMWTNIMHWFTALSSSLLREGIQIGNLVSAHLDCLKNLFWTVTTMERERSFKLYMVMKLHILVRLRRLCLGLSWIANNSEMTMKNLPPTSAMHTKAMSYQMPANHFHRIMSAQVRRKILSIQFATEVKLRTWHLWDQ